MIAKSLLKIGCLLATILVLGGAAKATAQTVYRPVPAGVYVPGYATYPYAYAPRRAYRQAVRYGYPLATPSLTYTPGGIHGYPYYGYPNYGYLYRPSYGQPFLPQVPALATPQPQAPPIATDAPTLAPEPIPAPPSEPGPEGFQQSGDPVSTAPLQ
jgi:hypothetical protein